MRPLLLLSTLFLALAACGDDSSSDLDMAICVAITCPAGEVSDVATCSCKPVVDMAKHD